MPAKTAREAKIIIANIEIRSKSFLLFISGNYIRDCFIKQYGGRGGEKFFPSLRGNPKQTSNKTPRCRAHEVFVISVFARRYSDVAIQRWFASHSLAKTEGKIVD